MTEIPSMDLHAVTDQAVRDLSDDELDLIEQLTRSMSNQMSHPEIGYPGLGHLYRCWMVRLHREQMRRKAKVKHISELVHGPVESWWSDPETESGPPE